VQLKLEHIIFFIQDWNKAETIWRGGQVSQRKEVTKMHYFGFQAMFSADEI
jgi:hypothetical protein